MVSAMEHQINIAEAMETLIRLMVDRPEGVIVECTSMNDEMSLHVSVDPGDMGKVIGKQGRTARALRVLVAAMGMATKQRIRLEILQ